MIKNDNILMPSDGMVLTDGNVYLKKVYLCRNDNEENYYEITREEYEEILKQIEKENFNNIEFEEGGV